MMSVESLLYANCIVFFSLLMSIYFYLKYFVYNYWNKHCVPHEKPIVPVGNLKATVLGQLSIGDTVKENYMKFKQHKFHGIYMFHKPVLMINDPELIRFVLIKEFNKFPDRGLYFNNDVDPLSGHLFFLPGEKWKKLRAKLSPTFTSGKLKQMFPLLKEIGDVLVKITDQMLAEDDIIDVKDLISRYTNDTISSVAFGYNCNSLENPNDAFRQYGRKIFDQSPIKNSVGLFAPVVLDLLKIPLNPSDSTKFFTKSFRDMLTARRQSGVQRKDFINLLLQLIERGKLDDDDPGSKLPDSEKLSELEAAAQAFVFFIAGFETTSSTLTYLLYEISKDLEVQEKLYTEVKEAYESAEGITYDKLLNQMDYLHMVFSETLRMHPSVPFLNRVCIEDCRIPNSNFTIEKDTGVMISVTGLQLDPDIFPDPQKFDPMRFSKENIAKRSPYVYLPFGDGPRVCIGNRFAIVQAKMALVALVSQYKFTVCEKTPNPIAYSKRAVVQAPEGAVYLRLQKRT